MVGFRSRNQDKKSFRVEMVGTKHYSRIEAISKVVGIPFRDGGGPQFRMSSIHEATTDKVQNVSQILCLSFSKVASDACILDEAPSRFSPSPMEVKTSAKTSNTLADQV